MKKINFIFTIHFHQPTGQLEWVLERIYNNCYRLLLDIFKQFTDMKITVHVSGPLLLEMIDKYPEWIEELAKLGDHGTIEFLAGSYGEAILPILPEDDRVKQVKAYIEIFEKYFGYRPRGLWLPERVWEPNIVRPLVENGIEYVLLDDSTLYRSGRLGDDALYAWTTEDSGHRLNLLFIDTNLRYILPWRSHEEVFNYMLSRADTLGNRYLLWGSDAEKFGEWRESSWARWWLIEFFNKLRQRRHEIELIHPSEYIEKYGVRGLIYPPPGSYDKMLEWSGGFFRNFLIKYRESNNLHKKMIYLNKKLKKLNAPEEAWKYYYLAQCNDAYWHGLFGGIYLTHLRQALYEEYIKAERIAEEHAGYYDESNIYVKKIDFDYDGDKEVIIETKNINVYIKPGDGGTIFEVDYKEEGFEHNIINTMTRYWETYLEGTGFQPDWYRRVSAREHLWAPHISINDWINNTPFVDRSDFALSRYQAIIRGNGVVLRKIARVYPYEGGFIEVFIEKIIRVDYSKPRIIVDFTMKNIGDKPVDGLLGIEYTLAPRFNRVRKESGFIGYIVEGYEIPISSSWKGITREIRIKSPVFPDISLRTDRESELWVSPLNMPTRTEKGILQNFEGLGIMFVDKIFLEVDKSFSKNIILSIEGGSL